MNFTSGLRSEYDQLWETARIRPARRAEVDRLADRIVRERPRYEAAGKPHGVPWYVVGIIHLLESSGSFQTHLHNGDPLTARTVQVPRGRPATGTPPFTWEFSASDALVHAGLNTWKDWSAAGTLFVFERYNGFGYRKPSIRINSPYLWSFSGHYTKGKFVSDGRYDSGAVSAQCGAGVLLRVLADRGLVTAAGPVPEVLKRGARGTAVTALKRDLRRWFDATAPGEWRRFGMVDNDVFGAALEKAVKVFQGRVGLRDDGEVGLLTREALAAALPAAEAAASAVVKRGDRGPAVTALKRDLRRWFDATAPGEWRRFGIVDNDAFGAALEQAVKTFQARNGLDDDGRVGRLTREALAALAPAGATT